MKTKYKPLGQFLNENHDNDESVLDFLEKTAPYIGYIVHSFNSLEEELNSRICFEISDRSDAMGAIVIHKMSYSSKIDLFSRMIKSKELGMELKYPSFDNIIKNLKECGSLRNAVVHAEWENMTSDGYTYVNLRFNKNGWKQEYRQFDIESLEAIDDLIHDTYIMLSEFEEEMYNTERAKYPPRKN